MSLPSCHEPFWTSRLRGRNLSGLWRKRDVALDGVMLPVPGCSTHLHVLACGAVFHLRHWACRLVMHGRNNMPWTCFPGDGTLEVPCCVIAVILCYWTDMSIS
jgi:hypothetical protein